MPVAEALRRAAAHALVGDVAAPALDAASEHHLFRVLRVRDGQSVTVTDGAGNWRACRAVGRSITADGPVEHVERRAPPVTVAFAVPKHDRPEWIVQKLTELGVDRIVLLRADRSVVRWDDDRGDRRREKFARVIAEALQQSRGVWLPELSGPVVARQVLGGFAAAEPGGRPLAATDRAVAIGPEGGWSDDEIAAAGDLVAFATPVLRVETAAVAAAVQLVHAADRSA